MKNKLTNKRKKAMLMALESNGGLVAAAARKVGIERKTHYRWLESDKQYKEKAEDIIELVLDLSQSKLLSLIKKENLQAVMFHLRTIGKKRGFIEKPEVEVNIQNRGVFWLELEEIQKKYEEKQTGENKT